MKKLSVIAIVLSSIAICGQIFVFATQKENDDQIYQKAFSSGYKVYAPALPESLTFAGEKVPLDIYYVREGLDRELLVNMYWQSNTLLWMKRAGRCFPVIEPILKKNGIPEDFKYLCVIESGLLNVTSSAKASGYWQFMKATGQTYGLEINDEIDMRWDLEASTEAACKYLKHMYNKFGSWTSAAAAYNCGENGLSSRFQKQGVNSYYKVRLNQETTRYVYRILAAKLLMQNPQKYGYHIRKCDLYSPIQYTTTTLSGQKVDLYRFCQEHNTSYKMLRELNPWLQTEVLTNKNNNTYTVKIPIEDGDKYSKIRRRLDSPTEMVSRL